MMASSSSNGGQRPQGRANDREKALEAALGSIEKSLGKGSVMRPGADTPPPADVIPTGATALG